MSKSTNGRSIEKLHSESLAQQYVCHDHKDMDTWHKARLKEKQAVYAAYATPASLHFFVRMIAGII